MKESSSIRVSTGGKDSPEAKAPGALPSTARPARPARPAVGPEAQGCVSEAGHRPWGDLERWKQEWLNLWMSGFTSGVPKRPSQATRNIGHGKTTAQLGSYSVWWHRINHIHQQAFTPSSTKYCSFKKVTYSLTISCLVIRFKRKKKRWIQSLHFVIPPGKSWKSALSVQTSALTCSHVWKPGYGEIKQNISIFPDFLPMTKFKSLVTAGHSQLSSELWQNSPKIISRKFF